MKAVLIVLLTVLLAGCATSRYTYEEQHPDGTYVKAGASLRPKDFQNLTLDYGTFKLGVNDAKTADDPLANMVSEMMPIMLCAMSPAACPGAIAAGVANKAAD